MNPLRGNRRATTGPLPPVAGVGLRFPHHQAFVDTRPAIGWLEVHAENYMGGGTPLHYLETLRRDYPLSFHGVGLSLGSADGLDPAHLGRLQLAIERMEPVLVSEHLSWSVVGQTYLADLLPLPMTEEALDVVCRHVAQVQDQLGRQLLVENPSTYLQFSHSTIPEAEFLACVAARTGCGILCDVNNIYVSAQNHGWNASAYLRALPPLAIAEIHLAGHSLTTLESGATLRIDDHGSRVDAAVWALYREALDCFGPVPTLVEWDTRIPPLEVLLGEAAQADRHLAQWQESARHGTVIA